MKIEKINLTQFKKNVVERLNGIYVFITYDCFLCQSLLKNFEKFNMIEYIYVVDCAENVDYFMSNFGLDDMPTTTIFKEGKKEHEVIGVLYEKQMRELKEKNDSIRCTD